MQSHSLILTSLMGEGEGYKHPKAFKKNIRCTKALLTLLYLHRLYLICVYTKQYSAKYYLSFLKILIYKFASNKFCSIFFFSHFIYIYSILLIFYYGYFISFYFGVGRTSVSDSEALPTRRSHQPSSTLPNPTPIPHHAPANRQSPRAGSLDCCLFTSVVINDV